MKTMDISTSLRADAMFFDAACRNLDAAQAAAHAIESAVNAVTPQFARLREIQSIDGWHDNEELFQEFESLAITLESHETSLSKAYAPALQAIASVHMLTAASAEAHINERASEHLSGKELEHFDRCTLEGKWIFFAKMFCCRSFTIGSQPLQGLFETVKARNMLVHYKPRSEPWQGTIVPSNLAKLGLTIEAAEGSVATCRSLVTQLATDLGNEPPRWLKLDGRLGYFDVYFNRSGSVLTNPRLVR